MAVYLYQCLACNKEFEIEHSIKEDARERHPHEKDCDGPLKRLIAGGVSAVWKDGVPTPKTYL